MPFEIVQLLDAMPKGRVRIPRADKHTRFADLVNQIPAGKVAQFSLPRHEYLAFSAAMRAAGERVGKKVDSRWKDDSAYVSWVSLTEENRRKWRGGRRKTQEPEWTPAPVADASEEDPEPTRQPFMDEDIDPTLIGDLDAEVPPDVAAFQAEARQRRSRKRG